MRDIAKPFLRISLSLVFLYFGVQQVLSPEAWTSFIPSFLLTGRISAESFVLFNAFIELVFGILMLLGIYAKYSALILSLNLFLIAFFIGFNPLGIRDFGLALATFVVFLNGSDDFSLDRKFRR